MTSLGVGLFLFLVLTAPVPALVIETIDTSFFPRVSLKVRLARRMTEGFEVTVFENGRPQQEVRIDPLAGDPYRRVVSFVSSAATAGRRTVVIHVGYESARSTYRAPERRPLAHLGRRGLSIRATGPDFTPIPCRLVLLHSDGKFFEDLTSPRGSGRLGTGFVVPPGACYAELRLDGLDVPLDHFRIHVPAARGIEIHRTFGFLDLSGPFVDIADLSTFHLEVERTPSRFPSLSCNLAALAAALPPTLPPLTLPLPTGRYRITVRPGRLDGPTSSSTLLLDVIEGQRTTFPGDFSCK